MKKAFIYSCALLLTATLLCPVVAAADNPVAEEIHSAVAYGTPTIDGELDECYLQSQKIDYELQPLYTGSLHKNPLTDGSIDDKYRWDTGVEAYSYMLWDESNIYLYTSVKDDTVGIVDFDKVESDAGLPIVFTYQDGISVTIDLGDTPLWLFAERGNRFFGTPDCQNGDGKYTTLKGFGTDNERIIGLNKEYATVKENKDGYSVEIQIPLTPQASEKLILGSRLYHNETIYNYIDTLPYGHWSQDENIKTEPGFEDGVWYGEFIYQTKYNSDTASVIRRYADLVGTDSGDVNGDGAVDVRDIVRLMKNIASDITPEPVFDVSLDGELDSRDLVALMKKIALG